MSEIDKPLVTFALIAYNQERFIKEAVEAALAQTYEPMEIIISDDCSTDATTHVITKIIAGYRGPHKVIVNVNKRNLGVADHINRIMELAAGELVILGAGDDISFHYRTERLVNEWLDNDRPPALCSSFQCVDVYGNSIGDSDAWYRAFIPSGNESQAEILVRLARTGAPSLVGCTEAWTANLFKIFPPLPKHVWLEDKAISFRAWLAGEILFVNEALILYRQHQDNISNRVQVPHRSVRDVCEKESRDAISAERRLAVLNSQMIDLIVAARIGLIDSDLFLRLEKVIEYEKRRLSFRVEWWDKPIVRRWLTAVAYLAEVLSVAECKWTLPRLLPLPIFAYVWLLFRRKKGTRAALIL